MARDRGMCEQCCKSPQRTVASKGKTYYGKYCRSCTKKVTKGRIPYKRKTNCEACGKEPIIPELLHLDHIDGDSNNNTLKNYWTLCVTCHQIKSVIEQKNKQILSLSDKLRGLEEKLFEKEKDN